MRFSMRSWIFSVPGKRALRHCFSAEEIVEAHRQAHVPTENEGIAVISASKKGASSVSG